MIKNSYRKFTTFPTGDYSVFFMEDFLSNKDSFDKFIGQSPVGNIVMFAIKTCRHRLYTGCKGCRIIGVSWFRHKRRTRPFSVYEECAQLIIAILITILEIFITSIASACLFSRRNVLYIIPHTEKVLLKINDSNLCGIRTFKLLHAFTLI